MTSDQDLQQLQSQASQLAIVRRWMARHAYDPELREAIIELSTELFWASAEPEGKTHDSH